MKKKWFDLQLFADGGDGGEGGTEGGAKGGESGGSGSEGGSNNPNDPDKPKYTDADVDALINKKFAEWQKKQERQVSEAEKLGQMSAEEKANARMKALEDKLHEYELGAARAEMTKQARAILQDKGINVSDELLANLIAEDADTTKKSVESFATMFQNAVEAKVKEALKGDVPKKGGTSGMTKEQIMQVKNRAERQRLIRENMDLFK